MEFLNNIWTAISTPNETLITLLSIPLLIFIEAPLTFYLISNFFNIKFSKKQAFIYIASTVITALIANYVIAWPFNIVLNYSSAFIILFFIMKLNFIQSLIATLFPSIVFNLAVNLIANPYLDLLKINLEQSATIAIYRIPFVLLAYLIVFIFCLILKYKKITINILENFDKRTKTIITLNFIFGFLNIFLQGVLSVRYIDILPIEFTFFNFISLLFYFGLSFYSLAKIMNLVTTTQKLENEKEYNKTLHILHDSVRGFKHDFDNIVTTIGGYIKTNDMKGLEKYYSQLEEDCEKVNNLYILNPDIINNPGIYNLLTTKYSEAIEKGIKVNLTFLLDLNNLHMKIYEFARMLGILLDNAIEAASESDEKVLNIVFRNDSKNNRNIVLIENTYKDKNVNIDEIFNKGVTGKENHTGLGLWEVKQILKKNNNINLYTNKNDTYFSQQLEIYY
jgi:two-component system sensor histidine kinase AgrC